MTLRLLTMASLAWASSAMAQDWEAPVAPTIEDQAVEIENEGEYYATPVGTGMFLRGANNWGTRASLTKPGAEKAPYKVVVYQGLTVGGNPDDEAWCITFPSIRCGADYAGDFLFVHHFPNDVYCNSCNGGGSVTGDRANVNFHFTLNEDGTNTYRIEIGDHVDEAKYLGWDGKEKGEDGPIVKMVDESETSYVDWAFIPAEVYEATDFDALAEAFKVYEAKLVLYDVLNQAEEKEVELADIVEIYNNDASTVADIEAATATLRDRILKSMEEEDEELDVSSLYIKNYDCESIDGWTGDFNVDPFGRGDTNPESGAHFSGHFFEIYQWSADGTGRLDGNKTYWLKQTLELPAGKYRLEASVMACYQYIDDDGNVEEMRGVRLFADGGTGFYTESDEISSSRDEENLSTTYPELATIEFECVGPVTIGIKVENTNGNWVGVDNFKLVLLEKYGQSSLAQVNLDARVKIMEGYLAWDEDNEQNAYAFSKASRAALAALVDECKNNTDKSEAGINALIERADAMTADVKTEIAAYKKLADFYVQLEYDIEEYGEYGTLAEEIGQLHDNVEDQIEGDGAAFGWTTAQIEEVIASYPQLIEDGVRKFIAEEAKPGTDISVLIKNRDMDEGEHWVNQWGNPQIPGWHPDSNSPWGYDQSAGEFWQRDFDFYQDIEGLPEGKYTVSFQGFYRWGNPDEVVDGYDPDMVDDPRIVAVLYGNDVETKFKDIVAGRAPISAGAPGANAGVNEDGEDCRIPNSMSDAQYFFTHFPENYYTEATAIVGKDGHLRIGIKAYDPNQKGNRWVIFDSFRLRYDGNEADMYFEELVKQADVLIAKRDNLFEKHSLPQDIYDEVAAKRAEAEALATNPETTTEQCTTFMSDLKALSAKLDGITTTINALIEDYSYYTDADLDGEISLSDMSDEFNAIYKVAEDIVNNEGSHEECLWETTAQLESMTHNINAAYVHSFFQNMPGNVSAANPFEVTNVIRYASLGDEDARDEMKCWAGHVGGHVCGMVEVWNNNFDFHQTIVDLPKGYYTLTVDGCYRYGDVTDAVEAYEAGTEDLAAEVYATQNGTIWATPLMSVCTGATEDDIDTEWYDEGDITIREIEGNQGTYYLPYSQTTAHACLESGRYLGNAVTFYSDGGSVTLGVKKTRLKSGDSSVYDNFQLYYLGENAPAGFTEGVETGVKGIAATGVKMGYYTIGGLQLSRPQKGVNIVITTMPDGTQTTSKVLVK